MQVQTVARIRRPARSRAWSARLKHHGICKAFNASRRGKKRTPRFSGVVIHGFYADRSFSPSRLKTPPMSVFLKQAAKIPAGSKARRGQGRARGRKAQVREDRREEDEGMQLR